MIFAVLKEDGMNPVFKERLNQGYIYRKENVKNRRLFLDPNNTFAQKIIDGGIQTSSSAHA